MHGRLGSLIHPQVDKKQPGLVLTAANGIREYPDTLTTGTMHYTSSPNRVVCTSTCVRSGFPTPQIHAFILLFLL